MNDFPFPKVKLKRLAIVAAIEFLSIGQRPAVVDRDGVAGLGLARAGHRICDFDSDFCGENGGRQSGEEEWEAHLDGVDG